MKKQIITIIHDYKKKSVFILQKIKQDKRLQLASLTFLIFSVFLTVFALHQLQDMRSRARVGDQEIFIMTTQDGKKILKTHNVYHTQSLQIRIAKGDLNLLLENAAGGDDRLALGCPGGYNCDPTMQRGVLCNTIGAWCEPTPTPTPTSRPLVAPPLGSIPTVPTVVPRSNLGKKNTSNIRDSAIGTRVNLYGLKKAELAELGVGLLRVDIVSADPKLIDGYFRPDNLPSLWKEGYKVLYVYHPGSRVSKEEIRTRLGKLHQLTKQYQDFWLEIGNEPNSTHYWSDGDSLEKRLETFASFTKDTIEVMNEIDKNATLLIAALDLQGVYKSTGNTKDALYHQKLYMDALRKENIDLSKYPFALHAYNSKADVSTVADIVEETINPLKGDSDAGIWFTEVGVESHLNQNELVEMIRYAKDVLRAKKVFIHEYNGDPIWSMGYTEGVAYTQVQKYLLNL